MLRLASRAHVLDLLYLLSGGAVRFNALRARTRVNGNVLSGLLHDLADEGLVVRRELGGARPHVEYEATAAGRALLDALAPLQAWVRARPGSAAVEEPAGRRARL